MRLRLANAVEDWPFNAAVDGVSITSTAPPPPPPAPAPAPPSNAIVRGKLTLNKKNGTGKLAIVVPGPGTLTEAGKGKKKRVKATTLTAAGAGTIQVPLKPTTLGRQILLRNRVSSPGQSDTLACVEWTPRYSGRETTSRRDPS